MTKGKLRLRITQRLTGSIDGIQLGRFRPDFVYEVGTAIGSYLLALGAAEPVPDDTIALTMAPEQQMFGPAAEGHGYRPSTIRDHAADRSRKKE